MVTLLFILIHQMDPWINPCFIILIYVIFNIYVLYILFMILETLFYPFFINDHKQFV
jgi:hypothetical protein